LATHMLITHHLLHLLSFFFFLSLTRPPPRSTLFPYTTLFRSQELFVHKLGAALTMEETILDVLEKLQQEAHDPSLRRNLQQHHKDRKSTRLNSSHVSISYAVFCLKKKKKKNITNNIKKQKNKT